MCVCVFVSDGNLGELTGPKQILNADSSRLEEVIGCSSSTIHYQICASEESLQAVLHFLISKNNEKLS